MRSWGVACLIMLGLMGYCILYNNFLLFVVTLAGFPILYMIQHKNLKEISFDKRFKIKISNVNYRKSDYINKAILKISWIKQLQKYFIKSYSEDLASSAVAKSPFDVGLKSIKITLLVTVLCLSGSLAMFAYSANYAVFLILVIPFLVFFTSKLELKNIITDRRRGVENELLFFTVFCDIMDNVQTGIYRVFTILAEDKSEIFSFMKKEALVLDREVNVFGKSSTDALIELTKSHPSRLFVDFVQGYLTSQSFGGRDTGDYLADKTRDLQVLAKQKMTSYIETADKISEIVVFGLVMYPMFIVIGGSVMPADTIFFMIVLGLAVIPFSIILVIKKIETIQPFPNNSVNFRKEPIYIGVLVSLVSFLLSLQYWEIITWSMIAWSAANYILVRKNFTINANLDASIPRFIRDMNQIMLSVPSFFQAFKKIQETASYTAEFDYVLHTIRSKVELGDHIHVVMTGLKLSSWLSRVTINLLSFTSKSGTITPTVMEKLRKFSTNYLELKKEMAEKTTNGLIVGYMGSIVTVMIILIMPSIDIESFTQNISESNFDKDIFIDDTIVELNIVLLAITTFFSMTLISKIKYLTINYSLHSAIILLIITGMLYYDRYVGVAL